MPVKVVSAKPAARASDTWAKRAVTGPGIPRADVVLIWLALEQVLDGRRRREDFHVRYNGEPYSAIAYRQMDDCVRLELRAVKPAKAVKPPVKKEVNSDGRKDPKDAA